MAKSARRLPQTGKRLCVLTIFALAHFTSIHSAPPTTGGLETPQSKAARDYLSGMQALERADFKGAVAALTQAIENDPDNEEYVCARGVAETLSEDFPSALRDLKRADKLNPRDADARLWLATAYRMSGDAWQGSLLFMYDESIPHSETDLIYNRMAMEYYTSKTQGHYMDRKTQQW